MLPFGLFETRRLLGAAVGILGLFVTWRIGRRIGGPLAGLLALVLLATCPLYYGHMFMNPKDSPFAVAMAILLLGLVRAFEQYPRASVGDASRWSASVSACRSARASWAPSARSTRSPRSLLIVAVEARAERHCASRERAPGGSCSRCMPGVLLAYAVMALVWPWAVINPLNPSPRARIFLALLREAVAGAVRRRS